MDDANGIFKLSWEPTDNAIAKKKQKKREITARQLIVNITQRRRLRTDIRKLKFLFVSLENPMFQFL